MHERVNIDMNQESVKPRNPYYNITMRRKLYLYISIN